MKNAVQASASLAVERELRARAEQKEAEEKQERIAANAQLLAMQQAHAAEMEGLRVSSNPAHYTLALAHFIPCVLQTHESEVVAQWKCKIEEAEKDREKLMRYADLVCSPTPPPRLLPHSPTAISVCCRDLRASQDAGVTMECELSALKTHLADAEMKTKELSDLGKLAGEADIMKRRLVESEKERVREEEAFKAQVAELEA